MGDLDTLRAGSTRVFPGEEEGSVIDRIRATDRPERMPGRGAGNARNTTDPTAFEQIAIEMKSMFAVDDTVMVGDGGIITSARICQLRELGGPGWVTALRSNSIAGLVADGSVQQFLFDEADLGVIAAAVTTGRLTAGGVRFEKILGLHNMAKQLTLRVADGQFALAQKQTTIDAKMRIRAHMVIYMLAAYLVWHLRNEWAPLTFTYEHQPDAAVPVAPAKRSTAPYSQRQPAPKRMANPSAASPRCSSVSRS